MDDREQSRQGSVAYRHPLLAETLEWLTKPEALAAAKRVVKNRQGVGVQAQDLLSVAYDHVVRNFHNELERADGPRTADKYGAAVLSTVLKELYREVGHARNAPLRDYMTDGGQSADSHDDGSVPAKAHLQAPDALPEAPLDPQLIDEFRVAIESIAANPKEKAAALSFVTFVGYPTIDRDGIPQPVAGATEEQAFEWAGMWLAGERNVFPDAEGDPPAQRTMRNRKQKNVRAVIAQARALVEGREEKP